MSEIVMMSTQAIGRIIEERDAALAKLEDIASLAACMQVARVGPSERRADNEDDYDAGWNDASAEHAEKILTIFNRPAAQADEGVKG
jgi:hypothetical protein